mmetsp:Transcript_40641/g.97409  ORF Transcript_40641/g.97409 Transcript_40641/m.97409 type:complete len:254 (-) Transcript_40641:239-1000(-)
MCATRLDAPGTAATRLCAPSRSVGWCARRPRGAHRTTSCRLSAPRSLSTVSSLRRRHTGSPLAGASVVNCAGSPCEPGRLSAAPARIMSAPSPPSRLPRRSARTTAGATSGRLASGARAASCAGRESGPARYGATTTMTRSASGRSRFARRSAGTTGLTARSVQLRCSEDRTSTAGSRHLPRASTLPTTWLHMVRSVRRLLRSRLRVCAAGPSSMSTAISMRRLMALRFVCQLVTMTQTSWQTRVSRTTMCRA